MNKLFVLLCLLPQLLLAQMDTTFYNEGGVCSKDSAEYYRLLPEGESISSFSGLLKHHYYPSHQVKSEAHYLNGFPTGIKKDYFKNGQLESNYFKNDRGRIKYQSWYKNGQMMEVAFVDENTREIEEMQFFFSENGDTLINEGNGHYRMLFDSSEIVCEEGDFKSGKKHGFWKGFHDDGSEYYTEEYSHGRLLSGSSRKKGGKEEFSYTEVLKSAEPEVSFNEWYQKVAKYSKDNYTSELRRKKIQGKVYVTFVVEKDGSLSQLDVKEGTQLHPKLDKVAQQAVLQAGTWSPAMQRGMPVRQIMSVPIHFIL